MSLSSLVATFAVVATVCTTIAAAQSRTPVQAGDVAYGIGKWDTDSLGNHRVVVQVDAIQNGDPGAVRVHIPWRRRDEAPDKKNIIVLNAETGRRITDVARIAISREYGDIVFQPTVPGDYYVYFMPFRRTNKSANYPKIVYQSPDSTADTAWLMHQHLSSTELASGAWRSLPAAHVIGYQSGDSLDAFTPMEIIATHSETEALLARNPKAPYLVFPENRANPIRMATDIPKRWIDAGTNAPFKGTADRGEFYVFQIGVFAARQNLADVRTVFSNLRSANGGEISASRIQCFNTGGINWLGKPFTKIVAVAQGHVQALWIGVDLSSSTPSGDYAGTVTVTPDNAPPTVVRLTLHVASFLVPVHGDDDLSRLSRLRWLNSRLAEDNGIVPPFTPVVRKGDTVSVLGRSVIVDRNGFPSHILSRFADGNTRIGSSAHDIITAPVSIVVDTGNSPIAWHTHKPRFVAQAPGAMEWSAVNTSSNGISMKVHARLEFDGNIEYQVALSSTRPIPVRDIRIEVPYAADASLYMMGLGQKGGFRPANFHWKWDVQKNQDAIWIGGVTGGMQVSLKDEKYSRPLNTNFYHLKPLIMPASWSNDGRGGCDVVTESQTTTMLRCFSGSRVIKPAETLRYDFRLLITPFKTIDTQTHFTYRYFHAFAPVSAVAATGANVINVHHATAINPYLNYPFLRPEAMKKYIDEAHAQNMKVKIYYTVRELTDHTPELFALQSLGHEIFSPGTGGGPSWLQEHFGSDYTAGWFVPAENDAAVVTNGQSRWHNSYIEGLDWLARNVGIDGLYLDDVAFDRTTMQRVRKVLDRRRPGALIDLHSATQYDPADGFASSANLYMEYFPYINRLWFGEGFDYITTQPDYWLVEVSGIPFGLMGEMLQGGGNPWRGMVYGMTNRVYNTDSTYRGSPIHIWKAWDDFGITSSRMVGYWTAHPPVTTGRTDVLATSYVKSGSALVAIGSWAKDSTTVQLKIDWKALGIDSTRAILVQPQIAEFQEAATYKVGDPIPVAPMKGAIVIIRRQ